MSDADTEMGYDTDIDGMDDDDDTATEQEKDPFRALQLREDAELLDELNVPYLTQDEMSTINQAVHGNEIDGEDFCEEHLNDVDENDSGI